LELRWDSNVSNLIGRGARLVERRGRGQQFYEEYAYVLDYLLHGKPGSRPRYRRGAIVQMVGETYFTLLEASVRRGVVLKTYDRIYVGKNLRKEITYILGRIGYDELTSNAKMELANVVERIIQNREESFVNFFNTAQPVTPRMHALELIPGIGKKYMWQIVNEREKRPFTSFKDLQERVNIPNPARLLAKRVVEELMGKSKYRLFTRPS